MQSSLSNKHSGFTLVELMIAIMIFAIIGIISYRTLSSLVTTKQVVTTTQEKWNGISSTINWLNNAWDRSIPLVVRDENGIIIPAIIGKDKIAGKFDSQLELTLCGYIRDTNYGYSPPRRIGFRFKDNNLYLVTWPALNRIQTTQPQLDLLVDKVADFDLSFLYPDRQWRNTWPQAGMRIDQMPVAMRVVLTMQSGEKIMRQWAN